MSKHKNLLARVLTSIFLIGALLGRNVHAAPMAVGLDAYFTHHNGSS